MKLQEDSRRRSPFSVPPKHGPQFYFEWANHANNPGKALPELEKELSKFKAADSKHRNILELHIVWNF